MKAPTKRVSRDERTLENFYEQSLCLQTPWQAAGAVIEGTRTELQMRVECTEGEAWARSRHAPSSEDHRPLPPALAAGLLILPPD